jgi:hypothetical protein
MKTQYVAAFEININASGVLDAPLSRGMTSQD